MSLRSNIAKKLLGAKQDRAYTLPEISPDNFEVLEFDRDDIVKFHKHRISRLRSSPFFMALIRYIKFDPSLFGEIHEFSKRYKHAFMKDIVQRKTVNKKGVFNIGSDDSRFPFDNIRTMSSFFAAICKSKRGDRLLQQCIDSHSQLESEALKKRWEDGTGYVPYVVIGGGAHGQIAASTLAAKGMAGKMVMIEQSPKIGGTFWNKHGFRINSRVRKQSVGEPGLPGRLGALNFLGSSALLHPSDLTREQYPDTRVIGSAIRVNAITTCPSVVNMKFLAERKAPAGAPGKRQVELLDVITRKIFFLYTDYIIQSEGRSVNVNTLNMNDDDTNDIVTRSEQQVAFLNPNSLPPQYMRSDTFFNLNQERRFFLDAFSDKDIGLIGGGDTIKVIMGILLGYEPQITDDVVQIGRPRSITVFGYKNRDQFVARLRERIRYLNLSLDQERLLFKNYSQLVFVVPEKAATLRLVKQNMGSDKIRISIKSRKRQNDPSGIDCDFVISAMGDEPKRKTYEYPGADVEKDITNDQAIEDFVNLQLSQAPIGTTFYFRPDGPIFIRAELKRSPVSGKVVVECIPRFSSGTETVSFETLRLITSNVDDIQRIVVPEASPRVAKLVPGTFYGAKANLARRLDDCSLLVGSAADPGFTKEEEALFSGIDIPQNTLALFALAPKTQRAVAGVLDERRVGNDEKIADRVDPDNLSQTLAERSPNNNILLPYAVLQFDRPRIDVLDRGQQPEELLRLAATTYFNNLKIPGSVTSPNEFTVTLNRLNTIPSRGEYNVGFQRFDIVTSPFIKAMKPVVDAFLCDQMVLTCIAQASDRYPLKPSTGDAVKNLGLRQYPIQITFNLPMVSVPGNKDLFQVDLSRVCLSVNKQPGK